MTKKEILKELNKDINYINKKLEKITKNNLKSYPITVLKSNYPDIFLKKELKIKKSLKNFRKNELENILKDIKIVRQSRQLNVTEIKRTNRARIFALRETLSKYIDNDKLSKISNKDFQVLLDSGITEDLLNNYGSPNGFDIFIESLSKGISVETFINNFDKKLDIFNISDEEQKAIDERKGNAWKNE